MTKVQYSIDLESSILKMSKVYETIPKKVKIFIWNPMNIFWDFWTFENGI